jgi:hypothetical protein
VISKPTNAPVCESLLYFLHVSAAHVAIFREVHYKEYIHRTITKVFEPLHGYKMLKIIYGVKYVLIRIFPIPVAARSKA